MEILQVVLAGMLSVLALIMLIASIAVPSPLQSLIVTLLAIMFVGTLAGARLTYKELKESKE